VLESQKIIKACGGECEGKKTKYFKPLLSKKFLRFMVESQGSKVNSTDIESWQLKS
jgi:hypothetical protein